MFVAVFVTFVLVKKIPGYNNQRILWGMLKTFSGKRQMNKAKR